MSFLDMEISGRNQIVTVDASPTTILIAQFPANTSGIVTIHVVARDLSTGDTKCLAKLMPVKRNGGGLSLVGTPANLLPSAGDAATSTWDIQFNLSGDTVDMQVVGQAGKTIKWYAWVLGGTVT